MSKIDNEAAGQVTDQIVETFNRDGVVMVRGALSPEWLMLLEMGLKRVMADAGMEKHRHYAGEDGEFLETIRNFDHCLEIRRLLYDSPLADIMGRLIGSENVWYYADEFFIKDAGGCERTPWHQDTPYFPVAGSQLASAWISLDPLPKPECLEFVAGSHRGEMFDGFSPANPSDPSVGYYGEGLPVLPDIEADRSSFDIRSWEVQPGDVIFSSPSTIHGGGPTSHAGRRRALAFRCFGDDVVFAARPPSMPTVPLTPGLSTHLQPGDPLRSPWYPPLRPVPEHERYGQPA